MTHPLTRSLIVRRARPDVGAGSPEGRRLTMTTEILKNLETAESPEQLVNLQASLARIGTAELPQIQRDGGEYVHEHHGAGR